MKNILFSIVLFLLTAFVFSACLDEITLDNPIDLEESVAIQGSLIKGNPSRVDVFVSRLSNLTGVNLPKAILDAEVFIIDDENGTELLLDNINSGFYELEIPQNDPSFNVDINKRYQLKVVLVNGNEYISNLELMPAVPKITSLGLNLVQREIINSSGGTVIKNNIEFYVNTPLITPGSTDKARVLWELQGTYQLTDSPSLSCRPSQSHPDPKTCYIPEKINLDKVVVLDATKLNTTELNEYPIYEGGINFKHSEGYYMTFLQRSLTPDAFKYWESTNEMLQRTGSIFEAPAGKIESNFTNPNNPEEEIFGYFYATQEDTSRIYVDPSVVNFPATNCPVFYDPLVGEAQCCNCLKIDNSFTIKPSWWQ